MKYSLNIYMNRLFEIDLLRVFCIFLLVAFHSFSIYTGSWSEPHGLQFIPAYYWIGKFCYSFMLPLWVFISGFLWGYQVIEQKRIQTLKQLAKKKAQKLLFPCYVFGLIYLLVTGKIASLTTPIGIFSFLSGELHLWFLPMLFWIFIISYFILKSRLKDWWLLGGLVLISIIAWNIKSLGIGGSLHYLVYFQIGFMAVKYKKKIDAWCESKTILYLLILVFIMIFFPLTNFLEAVTPTEVLTIKERCLSQILMHIASFPTAILGIIISYNASIKIKNYVLKNGVVQKLAIYGFGIYIFHQFILMYLYYETNLIVILGSYYAPIGGLVISFVGSLILTCLCLKSKIGHLLLS